MDGPLAVIPGVNSNGISPTDTPGLPSPPAAVDPNILLDHITRVLEVTLGATKEDLEQNRSILTPSQIENTLSQCTWFSKEGAVALYCFKEAYLEDDTDAVNGEQGLSSDRFRYVLSGEFKPTTTCVTSVAFLKQAEMLDPSAPIADQIRLINLPGLSAAGAQSSSVVPAANPFQVFHSFLHHTLGPFFDAYERGQLDESGPWVSQGQSDSRTGIPGAKKKLAELELSLQHLQQNIEIPALSLPMHPLIQMGLDAAQTRSDDRPKIDLVPQKLFTDAHLLNQLQATVNGWIRNIQTITKTTRDPATGSASQEINFWISFESALENIEEQLRSDGVRLTLEVLRHAKRFQATVSFSADTGLKETMEMVQKYNLLMRDFPLEELLSSQSLAKVKEAIILIFSHLNKKLRASPYPIKRAIPFVEAISSDLDAKIHSLVNGRRLMHLEYREFQQVIEITNGIWIAWEDQLRGFTNVARETLKRRKDGFIPVKVNANHLKTKERLQYIGQFRHNHEQLQRTIINVLGPASSGVVKDLSDSINGTHAVLVAEMGDVDAVEEVAQAYAAVKDIDVLDVTMEGTQTWAHAEVAYNDRTQRVENSIIARLRDRLATARNANEMFRVFSKFNALFVRPKIRSAIHEYQTQLIDNVKADISALHERFKQQYGHSEAHGMAQLHDLPPVSGAVIWARQIERQLEGYMKRVEDILGKEWDLHAEGQKLQSESNMFRKKLDTRPVFDAWLHEVARRNLTISGRLFAINKTRASGNLYEIAVNFDPQIITLFKEVRNLLWLNYQVPHAIANISKEAKRVYPFAVSLMESVRTYSQTSRVISGMTDVSLLLSGYQNDAQSLIAKGIPLRWESIVHSYDIHFRQPFPAGPSADGSAPVSRGESKHVQFIREFASAVSLLQTKVATLASIFATVQAALRDLETCHCTSEDLLRHLGTIQGAVDQLNLENYVNLPHWVAGMNDRVADILRARLDHAIAEWIELFDSEELSDAAKARLKQAEPDKEPSKYLPQLNAILLEVCMKNQLIYLDPPLEFARASWLEQLHKWLSIICALPKIKATRYELRVETSTDASVEETFSELTSKCANSLTTVYSSVEARVAETSEYVAKWLQFQSLWDLRSEHVYDNLGDDLARWLQLLQELRKSRSTFDTSANSKRFGRFLTVDYEQVQVKVNAKYDQWQHEILINFASRLGARMTDVFNELEKARKDLETHSLEASSTAHAVSFITTVQQCKRRVKTWAPEIETFRSGQTTLSRQRYQFPSEWLHVDQVENEWATLNDILERKAKIVQDQTDALRAKIVAEDRAVSQKIADVAREWAEEKPVSGTIPPEEASSRLQSFDSRLLKLRNESEMVAKAKEALDLPGSPETVLIALLEEVQDFKSVWSALSTIWSRLNDLRETLWTSIQPRRLRKGLEELIQMTKDMPARMRQYAAFEHVQNVLRQLLKVNPLLQDMRSEAVRERHWIKIFKMLKPSKRYSQLSMTLGDVWDLQLGPSENIIRDVIAQAQGEMALEEFVRQVRETWSTYALDLIPYQTKCRLIRGWDDLFAKCSENLNSLQAMRHSPYYKEFEEEASNWEEKLNRVHVLFDVWIDVQRQWVYLEGVFTGNADIKHLLPMESGRFQNINSEFLDLMKKVVRSPFVLEVLTIPGVQEKLERLAQLLGKIQKALGEYLERERVSFPRFYFVGDEDLLEIIGNSNNTTRVAKHLRKMFAGIAGLITNDDNIILGLTSREGEQVMLRREVSLVKIPKVNEWLAALELSMKTTLAELLADAVAQFTEILAAPTIDAASFDEYVSTFPAQIVVLGSQVCWTNSVEACLRSGGEGLSALHSQQLALLRILAGGVLTDLDALQRKKYEHLITEFVHQRDVTENLQKVHADSPSHYLWLAQMRYAYKPDQELLKRLNVDMTNASLVYGYEYLGVADRLVRTPLTDRCFMTLTQALSQRLGGSPYGPAGTGKTESVKALGLQLGRFTLVFCCDDTFDFQAMGRIFLGICQVGAWGCFDEFNRLEERILSAVSQQIQNIQLGLRKGQQDPKHQIDLIGRNLRVEPNTGIFITMNPGYAGRSNLPDNLKKLFRSVAMSKPDKELIAEVMLYSQGFSCAKELSRQTVPFFDLCARRLSKQAHYDFGLRALKSVLVSSGGLKRARLASQDSESLKEDVVEPQIIVQSLRETMGPKLIGQDVIEMHKIEHDSFPGVEYVPAPLNDLKEAIKEVAAERRLVVNDDWLAKTLQLFQIQGLHHGVMMVGASGSGKSSAWSVLLQALQKVEGVEGVSHVIDPKVMSKEELYGTLDSTTREWTDGLFTSILRKIVDNLRGEDTRRHWIIFDGDVDPEWVENLNSVLDDNKLLTLPNGERLSLPPNVRIMFEVETLKYATLATVSRCGMVWFSADTVTTEMMISNYLANLRQVPIEDVEDDSVPPAELQQKNLLVQSHVADFLQAKVDRDNFIEKTLEQARNFRHIMEFTAIRALNTLFSLLNKACRTILEYNIQHADFPLELEQIEAFLSKKLLIALVWSLVGDCPLADRKTFGDMVAGLTTVDVPVLTDASSLIDYEVLLPRAEWTMWQNQVPAIEVNTHSVTQTDVVIPTLDTVRHEEVLYSWLAEHKPLLLCGPPGSGKTMTLFSALRKLPNMETVGLNFSSATTPELLVKTFEQHCEYKKTLNGVILSPRQIGRWLVVFCDEINLPAPDKYGTQRAISFLRQLVEQNGFWRTTDKTWVTLDRIQFVGACNPPTDAGRTPMGSRFLRHAPLIMVDYPGQQSLLQIYGTFNNAVLKILPSLRGHADALTKAMVQLYAESQKRFTPDIQPHYVYSPRELTRWVRGLYEAIKPLENLSVEGLVRIWAHEALRLFQDRLVDEDERNWTEDCIRRVALEHFPVIDEEKSLGGPILFSNWLSKNYVPVDRGELREFVKARLKTFCEEELDVPLILFNDVLEHVLRIDRVFRQPQGHLILIGVSGSGKTTLSRFVAWMNGLMVYQIKVHGKYSAADFDDDLRNVLRRCGCKGEKICFIMDESNVLDSGFLERMNTLLANAEVPGLFEGDEYATLMTSCREGAQRQGLLLDSNEELYKWFTQQIIKNLHVVFTMNPPEEGLSSKAATSPALFNRCVLNWFGDWSDQALFQVGSELTQSIDLDRSSYTAPDTLPAAYPDLILPPSHRDAVVNSMVFIHHSIAHLNSRLQKQHNKTTYLTPRHFLDFVAQYAKLHHEKREDLEEQQRHLNVGLDKLRETVDKVRDLRHSLADKKSQLERKDAEANEKLQRMIADQREAEKRKAASLEIREALEKQEQEITARRAVVEQDLARAEPAVLEAQKSVSNIKRQHLTEVRSMTSPPAGVKLALESVCTLLGHKAADWRAIQAIIRRDDFIASIVTYDNEAQMTKNLRVRMRNEFLSKEEFTFERVNRASRACGPLVQWVEAQVNFSEILDRVGPLREEVVQLQDDSEQTKAEAMAVENEVKRLEASIGRYKEEYAALISQTQSISTEMKRVQNKVDRSVRLLESLSSERGRWEETSKSFETQIDTLVGDVLVAAAFVTYGGFYDQQYRQKMSDDWRQQLTLSGIKFKPLNPVTEYLSSADERLKWQANTLPVDDLCTENAIILKRFNRYPLIIDPSGRVNEFLQNECKDRRLTVTSFLDDSFVKQLESSLRFGNPILIQDAEHLDPILTHVLNKEYQKTGGRVLIQLGKQEIDFSPSFKLYLSTRDPSATFAPDICSRTTFVNFTITQSSLRTQSLNEVLKSERPDVDERRSNLIKMQGEFNVHLRQLEKQLLQALNESRGNILDDDNVIETLETLKKEAGEISAKVEETEGVMTEVENITLQYTGIARSCAAIFAVLEQVHHINHFYQFSLQYFIDIFETVLSRARQAKETHHQARIDLIIRELFINTYRRTSMSLLQKDRVTLAMLLAQAAPFKMDKTLIDLVLDKDLEGLDVSTETTRKDEAMARAMKLRVFKDHINAIPSEAWDKFSTEELAEQHIPPVWSSNVDRYDQQLRSLVLVKIFRIDRLVPAVERFVTTVFGKDLLDASGDLGDIVDQVQSTTPIALSSSPGFDASYKVDNLVERMGVHCTNIAMGSSEGLASADKAVSNAAATGSWVLVKNVHLAPTWLQSLEKRIDSLKPHKDFRLFLSMETSPKIPVNLLRASRVLMYEQPAGIRANMKDSLASAANRATQEPVERARIYFLLSFLHAVVQERLRYAPRLGWKGFWEFNDSDYECCAFIIDYWVDSAAQSRSNINPTSIPWDIIRVLITEMYGGKIDDEEDHAVLSNLVSSFMTPDAFEENHLLVQPSKDAENGLAVPPQTSWKAFMDWVNVLPEREPPAFLGLPANAEKLLLKAQAKEMVGDLGMIMDLLDEGERIMAEAEEV
ncbi:putative dynein heavy chain, cytosolic [Eremomyces bilateralis CBS 781.70]|uniref:Dynein heavy chain, cytoplasmic n=1 Tax=Eremomyces bilateralis CBS 781.70 TaxID=1392243 RepID=A0A6G1GGN3_9PEZI|nr:putative dynein heavy chain, cytosolic [Eremomyces bilateralis CBS 781.70]KAF1817029.1 putative dynein heavy chain, cytosolic [Eremomyces bilateralis CBS 781.70]